MKKSDINLILDIKDSSFLAVIFLLIHFGGMLVMAVIPVDWLIRIIAWALLGGSFFQTLRIHAWRTGASAITAIEMDSEGVVAVRFAGNETWHSARITARFVHSWLTLMSLRVDGRRLPVNLAIAADAVEPEPFRRWRAALKLQTAAT